jgi:purine-binding chemotaxis protein CheW
VPGPRLLCTFQVAELYLGLDIAAVQEVLRGQHVTRLPLAADPVRGIINLRGRIVPAIDLRRCLRVAGDPGPAGRATLVVRSPEAPVSLLVDRVEDVIEIAEAELEPVPETMRLETRELLRGVVQRDERLLLELDLGRVLRAAYT